MINLVEGWTVPIDYVVKADGTAVNLATHTAIAIQAKDKHGVAITLAGAVSFYNRSSGVVRYSPTASDFDANHSPYYVRFKIADSDDKYAFFPDAEGEKWVIRA